MELQSYLSPTVEVMQQNVKNEKFLFSLPNMSTMEPMEELAVYLHGKIIATFEEVVGDVIEVIKDKI